MNFFCVHQIHQKIAALICLCFLIFGGSVWGQSDQNNDGVCAEGFENIVREVVGGITNNPQPEKATVIDTLVGFQDTGTVKGKLIEYYCDTWLKTHDLANTGVPDIKYQCFNSIEGMKIDPRQSFFMYGLCVGYDEAMEFGKEFDVEYTYRNWKELFETTSYVQADTGEELGVDIQAFIPAKVRNDMLKYRWNLEKQKDVCHPQSGMANCLMGYPSSKILYNVFSGLFDIKKAAIDGYDHGTKRADKNLATKDLSRSLFNTFGSEGDVGICNNQERTFVDKKESGASNNDAHCGHPQTWGFVQGMISAAIKNVDQVDMLDGHEIMKTECRDLRIDIAACAMSNNPYTATGSAHGTLNQEEIAWRNLIENELFFANLWKDYYHIILEKNPKYIGSEQSSNLGNKLERAKIHELNGMEIEFGLIQNAVDMMTNLLTQYRSMYHQCVALYAHQEDVHTFRKEFNRMYTPLHQLKYLTEDAQENKNR